MELEEGPRESDTAGKKAQPLVPHGFTFPFQCVHVSLHQHPVPSSHCELILVRACSWQFKFLKNIPGGPRIESQAFCPCV